MPGARCGEPGRTRLLPGLWEVLMGKDPPMCPRCGSGSALPAPVSPSHAVGPRLGSPRGSRTHRIPPGSDVSIAELWLWDTLQPAFIDGEGEDGCISRERGRSRTPQSRTRTSLRSPRRAGTSPRVWLSPRRSAELKHRLCRGQAPPPNPADISGWESIRWGELGINGSTRPSQPPSFPGTKRDTGHSPTAGGTGTASALSPAHPALPPSFLGFGVCFPDAHSRGNTQCLCRRCPPPTRHPRASLPGTAKSAAGKGPGSRLR